MTEKRRARLLAALAAAVLTTGCGSGQSTTASDGGSSSVPSSRTPSVSTPSPRAPSTGAVGGRPFTLYTHCGVESLRLDGRWWHASPPLHDESRSGPPAGWGDPHQEGTLTEESEDRVVFEALGRRVVFVPAPDDRPVRMCD